MAASEEERRRAFAEIWLDGERLWDMETRLAEERRKQKAREEKFDRIAEQMRDEFKEVLVALADAAGLTLDKLHELFHVRRALGVEILHILAVGKAESVEEAVAQLYREAGDEAGKTYDGFQHDIDHSKFGPGKGWSRVNREMDAHDNPRRSKTRADVQRKAENFFLHFGPEAGRELPNREADLAFDALVTNYMAQQKNKNR